jgi:hypothetical protein
MFAPMHITQYVLLAWLLGCWAGSLGWAGLMWCKSDAS